MILQACLLLTLSVACEVSGVSYSNVFVHTGEAAPAVEYYGAYPYNIEYASPKIAQYKAPVKYDYPYGSGSYSYRVASNVAEPVATVAAVPASSSVYPAYTPSISNLYGARADPNGYDYAYVYVPSPSGAELRQLNEGEVYRGGFSHLQPDLVQYVTDNNQGLNAIFKNYLSVGEAKPSNTAHHETPHHDPAQHASPCHEGKSAALIEPESHHEHKEEEPEERHGGHEHEAHETPAEHESQPTEHEGRHAENESHPAEHEAHEEHEPHHAEHEARHGGHNEEPHEHHEAHEDNPHHEHNIIIKIQESPENDEPTVEIEHHIHAHPEEHEHPEGHDHSEGHNAPKEEAEEPSPKSDEHAHTHEKIVEEPHGGHDHAGHGTTVALAPDYPVAGNNVFISYNDFIKCIQAALARGNSHPYYAPSVPKPVSPLTYLIYNKPC